MSLLKSSTSHSRLPFSYRINLASRALQSPTPNGPSQESKIFAFLSPIFSNRAGELRSSKSVSSGVAACETETVVAQTETSKAAKNVLIFFPLEYRRRSPDGVRSYDLRSEER